MKQKTLLITSGLLLGIGLVLWMHKADPEQERAIAEIQKLGGRVEVDTQRPGTAGLSVFFNGPGVTDASLVCLESLRRLQALYLCSTRVTDLGLAHVQGL